MDKLDEMDNKAILDIYSREYYLTDEIKRGGQGVVYRTKDPDIAIKMELRNGIILRNPSVNKKYLRLCYLPIADSLHITRPLTTLKDITGYTMILLSDMVSFEDAFDKMPDKALANEWIQQTFNTPELENQKKDFTRYFATGGSRRRLKAYLKAANIFARLHENGLVYGDLNKNNLFLSSASVDNAAEVWLIDVDNVDYIDSSETQNSVYTSLYCAPEAPEGEFSFASDCYAFATLLFEQLTMQHPFKGLQYVDWDDFDGPPEDEIASGHFAWIWDTKDGSNFVRPFLEREFYLSKEIEDFFTRTFSEDGRQKPAKRPSMVEWGHALAQLLDYTVVCPYCGMGYNAHSHHACPWCDSNVPLLSVKCTRYIGDEGVTVWEYKHEISSQIVLEVPTRAVGGFVQDEGIAFQVEIKNSKILFSRFNADYCFTLHDDGYKQAVSGKLESKIGTHLFTVKDLRDDLETEIEVQCENEP